MISTISLIMFFFSALGAPQSGRNQAKGQLEQIRKEIESYRRKLQQEQRKEKQLLDSISQLEREIDLTHQLVMELEREEQRRARMISKISQALDTTQTELDRLQQIYARRVVSFYKYGRVRDLELLLSSRSFTQALAWLKFQRLIAKNDQRNYNNILKKKNKIEVQRSQLKQEAVAHRQILNEKRQEEARLRETSKKRGQLLAQVQNNKQALLQRLKEYELSMKEIQRLIQIEEDKRIGLEQQGVVQATDFPSLKGRMIWPTRGRIINHFGRYQHPKFKGVTLQNIGIDIQAEYGQEVRATGKGIVTAITWQRGRGNIVMINHFGGYFTVYTHLAQIFVQVDDSVEIGQVIGTVGDSGSLTGPQLHFEIWKNKQPLNPEDWLS
ncbi:MAG: peptidoglycan DD-metalloendopeptidase family protein [candidate division KSB1 bacterium]|nr:peptidoglycan DD-metalloendopeptidase family protein [candidate division KSB1 bacterium]MDZ7334239.1 peptidoglycan DD-metalloendopeptidase family protein [candidate division KSB1 bacterium]MDZ7356363.1 peptidoglycan DD-metalloendopeptidase family protein [candidate division KSB1 bacterium]MDZ7376086.1 peptidoglycan DD-metalloendopeptidase family protein [candidate division KSB1 bacterium]MDZ7401055.1 peptidoglycan DD-metalloendopeptidase family protein [candidate division KSB1 bacterium]